MLIEKKRVDERVAEFGPVITDGEFFAELDGKIPALKAAKEAFGAGDTHGAYRLFYEHIKEICKPELFFSLRGRELKPEFTEQLKTKAENAMNHLFVSVGVPMQFGEEIDWSANPTENNYSEWNIQLHRHAELKTLAKAYRATGDERYAEELVRLLLHWIRNVPRCKYDSNTYSASYSWRGLECAGRCDGWTEMVHSLIDSPAFTPEACVTIYKSLYEHCVRISTVYSHGNWYFIELEGMAIFNVATPVFSKSSQWREDVARRVMEALDEAIYPDGVEYELAPGYMYGCLLDSNTIENTFAKYGYSMDPRFYGIIRSMLEFYVKVRMADGLVPGVNDSPNRDASVYVNRYLVEHYGCSSFAKWVATHGEEGEIPDFNSCLLPYGGIIALRTGWGEGDISAYFDAGKYGRDHFHEDKLNLLIHSDKKPLVTECGTYAYDASAMRNYCTQTEGHNTVMVDGLGQTRLSEHYNTNGAQWAHVEEPIKLIKRDGIDYAHGYYDETYGVCDNSKFKRPEVPSERLARHDREVILVKKPLEGKPYFIAVDRMTDRVGKKHKYTALWHINVTDEELSLNGSAITSSEITVLTSGFDSISIVKGQEDPVQGWICRSSIQGDYYAAPTLICEREGKDVSFATLFAIGEEQEVSVCAVELSCDSVTVRYKSGAFETISLKDFR